MQFACKSGNPISPPKYFAFIFLLFSYDIFFFFFEPGHPQPDNPFPQLRLGRAGVIHTLNHKPK